MHQVCCLLFLSCCGLAAQATQQLVVPCNYSHNYVHADANSYVWIAGASQPLRQQTMIGASHLQQLTGRLLTGFALRRTAADELYLGGTTTLSVTLSTARSSPLQSSEAFAANPGPDAVSVFQGNVVLPTSPSDPGPNIAWSASNIVQVTFTQPFRYQGGTLCIDVTGTPIQGQTADWWMADAVFEDLQGSAAPAGNGCGSHGGPQGEWSAVATRSLVTGNYATFKAWGPRNGLGIAVFGAPSPVPIPMSSLGVTAPNCFCHINPAFIVGTLVEPFVPFPDPRYTSQLPGSAEARIRLPHQTWVLGMQLATQWLDLSQPAVSNAILWTVSTQIPTLDMTLVEGHPNEATGKVSAHLAHVMRLDHRAP